MCFLSVWWFQINGLSDLDANFTCKEYCLLLVSFLESATVKIVCKNYIRFTHEFWGVILWNNTFFYTRKRTRLSACSLKEWFFENQWKEKLFLMRPDKLQRQKLVLLLLVIVLGRQCRGKCDLSYRVGSGINQGKGCWLFLQKWLIFGSTDWKAMNWMFILSPVVVDFPFQYPQNELFVWKFKDSH